MGLGVADAEARQYRDRQDQNGGYYGNGLNWDGNDDDFHDADDGYGGNWGGGGGNWGGGGGYGGYGGGREDVADDY